MQKDLTPSISSSLFFVGATKAGNGVLRINVRIDVNMDSTLSLSLIERLRMLALHWDPK